MNSIGLKVKKRAMPSRGRARVNESVLEMLEIAEGDKIDLSYSAETKPLTVTVYADSMVEEGAVRLDENDMEKLGIGEDAVVTAVKTPTLTEKLKSATSGTAERVSGAASTLEKKVTGKSEETEESAEKKQE